jgi:hypothetical protein
LALTQQLEEQLVQFLALTQQLEELVGVQPHAKVEGTAPGCFQMQQGRAAREMKTYENPPHHREPSSPPLADLKQIDRDTKTTING